jgi:hypothetical protein
MTILFRSVTKRFFYDPDKPSVAAKSEVILRMIQGGSLPANRVRSCRRPGEGRDPFVRVSCGAEVDPGLGWDDKLREASK